MPGAGRPREAVSPDGPLRRSQADLPERVRRGAPDLRAQRDPGLAPGGAGLYPGRPLRPPGGGNRQRHGAGGPGRAGIYRQRAAGLEPGLFPVRPAPRGAAENLSGEAGHPAPAGGGADLLLHPAGAGAVSGGLCEIGLCPLVPQPRLPGGLPARLPGGQAVPLPGGPGLGAGAAPEPGRGGGCGHRRAVRLGQELPGGLPGEAAGGPGGTYGRLFPPPRAAHPGAAVPARGERGSRAVFGGGAGPPAGGAGGGLPPLVLPDRGAGRSGDGGAGYAGAGGGLLLLPPGAVGALRPPGVPVGGAGGAAAADCGAGRGGAAEKLPGAVDSPGGEVFQRVPGGGPLRLPAGGMR